MKPGGVGSGQIGHHSGKGNGAWPALTLSAVGQRVQGDMLYQRVDRNDQIGIMIGKHLHQIVAHNP